MIYRFRNNNSYLNINKDANIIDYNKKNYNIIKIFLIEKLSGKIETEDYIVKWSKKELHIYDKLYSLSFLEKMEFVETDLSISSVGGSEEFEEKKFYYSKKLNIIIKQENSGSTYIIGPGDLKELVIDIKKNVNSKIYTTISGNKLTYSKTIPCKYNNLGIHEII